MGRLSDFGIEAFGEWMIIRAHFLKSLKSCLIMYLTLILEKLQQKGG